MGAPTTSRRIRGEDGTVVIMVAISILGLLAFSAFSVDHGVMMTARAQAQTAADAGAMAGALYLAWDDGTDLAGARDAAVAAAQANGVFGATPDVTAADVTFPTCPPGAPGPVDQCVRVDVFRNERANGNPLPVFFSSLAGRAQQGVRATATAQVLYGSAPGDGDCIKPFAIPDRWVEGVEDEAGTPPLDDDGLNPPNFPHDEDYNDVWDTDDSMDIYVTQNGPNRGNPLPLPADSYDPAVDGYRITPDPQEMVPANSNGLRLVLKAGNGTQISPSWYYPYVIADGCGTGASCYRDRITGCANAVQYPGDILQNEPGNMQGPTQQGANDLIAQDPTAAWATPAGYPRGIVQGGLGMESPRLAVVPAFDGDVFLQGHQNGRIVVPPGPANDPELVISRYVGIFIDSVVGNDVIGHISPIDFSPGPNNITDDTSSFLRTVVLVR